MGEGAVVRKASAGCAWSGGVRHCQGSPKPSGASSDEAQVPGRILLQMKALPFGPLAPNGETIAAMREARGGKLPRFKSVDALMKDLNADD